MHRTPLLGTRLLFLVGLLLPRLLFADTAPVTSAVLPSPYQVLCNAEPQLRAPALRPYVDLLAASGQPPYRAFWERYEAHMRKLVGTPEKPHPGDKYPIVLAWVHPATQEKVYLDAYVNNHSLFIEGWDVTLKDQHNPLLLPPQIWPYRGGGEMGVSTLQGAIAQFLESNPYPQGMWEMQIYLPGEEGIHAGYASQNRSTLPPDFMRTLVPALQFQSPGGALTDCARRTATSEPYAIKKLEDPRLASLGELTMRVRSLLAKPLQRGARLTYLQSTKDQPLASAVVFVDPASFSGFLVDPVLADALVAALAIQDPKPRIDQLHGLLQDPTKLVPFKSYDDLTKLFYREVFAKESVLDPKEVLDLREQKGWEEWKRNTKKLLADIEGLTVNANGCIQGKYTNGDDFEVCGERAKKGDQVTFFSEVVKKGKGKKKSKVIVGHAHVGQVLHSHRGRILDKAGKPVAYIPASTWTHKRLYRALTLVMYGLPRDAFQAVADVFSLPGLWDVTVATVKGLVRYAIVSHFDLGWWDVLYKAATTIYKGYRIASTLETFWDKVSDAKEEYQLYDASNEASPFVQALIKQAIQGELVEKAQGAILAQVGTGKTATKAETKLLPDEKRPKGLLTAAELSLDSHEKYLLTDANAEAALQGPANTTPEVEIPEDEHGVDIIFKDTAGNTALTREVKSVGETGKAFKQEFAVRLEEGARQEGEEGPRELMIQVPAGQDVQGALQHFRDQHKGQGELIKYQGEPLTVVGPGHEPLYQGPVLEEPLSLIKFPSGDLGIEVGASSTKANVTPQVTEAFANTCERRPNKKQKSEYEYQRRILGPNEIVAKGGGTQVEADGINIQEGYLQDAKFVKNPASSLYLENSGLPQPYLSMALDKIDKLFFRYGEVIRDPSIPVRGLEIITNDRRAFPFFKRLMEKHGIPGRIVERK